MSDAAPDKDLTVTLIPPEETQAQIIAYLREALADAERGDVQMLVIVRTARLKEGGLGIKTQWAVPQPLIDCAKLALKDTRMAIGQNQG